MNFDSRNSNTCREGQSLRSLAASGVFRTTPTSRESSPLGPRVTESTSVAPVAATPFMTAVPCTKRQTKAGIASPVQVTAKRPEESVLPFRDDPPAPLQRPILNLPELSINTGVITTSAALAGAPDGPRTVPAIRAVHIRDSVVVLFLHAQSVQSATLDIANNLEDNITRHRCSCVKEDTGSSRALVPQFSRPPAYLSIPNRTLQVVVDCDHTKIKDF